MSTYNSIPDHLEIFKPDLALKIQRRLSFPAPDESCCGVGADATGEDHGSISSECTYPVSSSRPMSTSVSSAGDESIFNRNHTNSLNTTFVNQLPKSFVQPAGSQVYPSVIYNQQHHCVNHYTHAPMGIPSWGYTPIAVQPVPMNISMPQPMQQQRAYPVQQSYSMPQYRSHVPISTSAVPCITGVVACPQLNNPEIQYASSGGSSTVSTPIFSCLSSPGWGRYYGSVNTPLLSSASCSPILCSMPEPEVLPVLDLNQYIAQGSLYPQKVGCNSSMGLVSPVPGTPVSLDAPFANSARNKRAQPGNLFSGKAVEKITKAEVTKKGANLWNGSLNYEEYKLNGGSNLFVTWSGSKAELVHKLQSFRLGVREVLSTSDKNVCNVIFESHPIARKAFTMQQRIRLRIVPPKNSRRIWFRNPSPTFLVKFETKFRLPVKKGKAERHDVVGQLSKGCLITADQLKGNRIRVKLCEGTFMCPGGKTVEMTGLQKDLGKKTSLGWISYRSKHSNKCLLIRRSSNSLEDYVYST